jgi:hypothetical protein
MSTYEFFYECDKCKCKMLATSGVPLTKNIHTIIVPKGKVSDITFRCDGCQKKQ